MERKLVRLLAVGRSAYRSQVGTLCVAVAALVLSLSSSTRADSIYVRNGSFSRSTVIELARTLSKSPFATPKRPLPEALADLDYDQYRDLRFRSDAAIWARTRLPYQVQLFHRGFLFADPVEIAVVKGATAERLVYSPRLFVTGSVMTTPLPDEDIGFSGFRLHYPLNRGDYFDELAVFQGASYFRAVGRNQIYGQSARGLAIKTADPEGEEFPAFRAFWIEKPASTSKTITVHALLDSPSVSGAYRFNIRPGDATVMDVDVVLFPRTTLDKLGLAPATSMFLFSVSGRGGVDDFRARVHDSDGLFMVSGVGERLWRPLANPAHLQVSAFQDRAPKGFGLLQRERRFEEYQDLEAHYERRPSLWIEPVGDWGEGAVVLVEIPSRSEIHDNVVVFWSPHKPIPAGSEFRFSYRLHWGNGPQARVPDAHVLATRSGRADPKIGDPGILFVVDYSRMGAGRSSKPPRAHVSASVGEVKNLAVRDNPATGGHRVSFLLDPQEAELSELRLDLDLGAGRRAETWMYRWTAP